MSLDDSPTEKELEWDQERINQLDLWYYVTGSTDPEEHDDFRELLWDTYHNHSIEWNDTNNGCGTPAPSGMGYIWLGGFDGKLRIPMYERAQDAGYVPITHYEQWDYIRWGCGEQKGDEQYALDIPTGCAELEYNAYELLDEENELDIPTEYELEWDDERIVHYRH